MNGWTPTVFLDSASREPIYLQIAHSLMPEIHRGRLKPGDSLFFDADAPHGPEGLVKLPARYLSIIAYPQA